MKVDARASGILLHVTSLPSDFGVGDLGPQSYEFVDILNRAHQSYWSILPLTPTSLAYGNSPYQTDSSFAGNILLLSPELLTKDKLLSKELSNHMIGSHTGKVDYKQASKLKQAIAEKAYHTFSQARNQNFPELGSDFDSFCHQNSEWLDDYALYRTLRKKLSRPWHLWPISLRDRQTEALREQEVKLGEHLRREKFMQFLFFRQWQFLKAYCGKKNVKIMGDLAFYVNHDSADVWAHPNLFELNEKKRPRFVGGVPPDYFSKNGQLWGNPTFRWTEMEKTGFAWWTNRIQHSLRLFDSLRLDHFRGFIAYWRVPAGHRTARKGKWVKGSSKKFFGILEERFPDLPFVAEDLGVITGTVKRALKSLHIPGMRVLVFAFNDSWCNPHLPKNHTENSVVYTGTHDTNTVRGWFMEEATVKEKKRVFRTVGKEITEKDVSHEFIKLALTSKAALRIIPMQDILALGSEARMNNPAHPAHNWTWQLRPEQLAGKESNWLGEMTRNIGNISGRMKFLEP